jgi:predicted RND superfamily exporter protein
MTVPESETQQRNSKEDWLIAFSARLAHVQLSAGVRLLVLVAVLSALLLPVALKLRMNSDLSALLPSDAMSVVDKEVLSGRLGISSTLTVAVQHERRDVALRATERFATLLAENRPSDVSRVESGLRDFQEFVSERRTMYLELPVLEQLRDDLELRYEADKAQSSVLSLGLEDDLKAPSWKEIEDRVRGAVKSKSAGVPKYERGVFSHPDLPLALLFVRTTIHSGDLTQTDAVVAWINSAHAKLKESKEFSGVRIDLGGDLMDASYETRSLARQMAIATIVTLLLVLASVYFFFRSFRSLPILALVLVPPIVATFAFAAVTVEYLNTSTAFLMSIVIGNGINPSIMWLARYREERLRGHSQLLAVQKTHMGTFRPTMAASFAAAFAYGSLAITDFRGFRDFGIVGGLGMVLCWTAAIGFLPLLATRMESRRVQKEGKVNRENPYGPFFVTLALRKPRLVLVLGALTTVIAIGLTARFIANGPIEYDFRKLISIRDPDNRIQWVNDRQREVVTGTQSGNALAILLPSREDVPKVVADLESKRDARPGLLGQVRSIDALLPKQQAEKLPIVADIREILMKAVRFASKEDAERLKEFIPPEDLKVATIQDLPADVRGTFTERDGTVGRLIFSERAPGTSAWDARYWSKWTTAVREIRTGDGERPPSTGTPMIFADVLRSVTHDAPRAFALAGLATIFLIQMSIRGRLGQIATLCSLLLGMLWMVGGMSMLGIRLHFLNLLAFPIALGNGVDYAVNVVQRYNAEFEQGQTAQVSAAVAVRETGGAVVLCSLTTIIGYLSIHISDNQALRSFAAAMALAETTCVITAVVLLPAWLGSRSKVTVPEVSLDSATA